MNTLHGRLTTWTYKTRSQAATFEAAAAEVRATALHDVPDASFEIVDNWITPKGSWGFEIRRERDAD